MELVSAAINALVVAVMGLLVVRYLGERFREQEALFTAKLQVVSGQIAALAARADLQMAELGRRIEELRAYMDTRFEQVDKRFELVDKRFEQVDTRFEQVDKRFELVDKRFEQVDAQFAQIRADIRQMREEVSALRSDLTQLAMRMHAPGQPEAI